MIVQVSKYQNALYKIVLNKYKKYRDYKISVMTPDKSGVIKR